MEKLKTRSFGSRNARRQLSGFLASVLVFVFVFEQFFVSLSYGATAGNLASASDAVRSGKVSWKNSGAGEVQIAVLSDEPLYEAGDQVCLDVYIKNNTDREIDDGLLKFKAGGILEDSVYFEDIGTVYQERQEDGEGEAAGDEASDEEKAEDGKESADKTSEDGAASEEEGKDWGELSYTVSKPLTKEDADGADEEVMDGGEEEEVDLSRVTDLILEPGEIRYVQFYFTIDDEIEGNKSQTIKFTFSGKAEDKPVSAKETFRYVVGAMNLLPIGVGNEGNVAAGETARMQLDFELGDIEDEIIEREMELGVSHKAANAKIDWASASDASASDADREDDSDDASGNKLIKWDGEKADSGKKEDQPIIKNLKCTIDTPGLKLNGFKVERRGDDEYGTSTVCTFEVDENAEPGVYFGQVTASYQIKSKKFQTSQSVMLTVSNDREVEMEALTDDPDVLEVIRLIDGLPTEEEVTARFAAIDEDDEEGYEQCLVELYGQVMPVWEKYQTLTEEQQAQVSNKDKLLMYEWLLVMPMVGWDGKDGILMTSYPRGTWDKGGNAADWISQKALSYMNGWHNTNYYRILKGDEPSKGFSVHAYGHWNAEMNQNKVAYCIEPGVPLSADIDPFGKTPEDSSYNKLAGLTGVQKDLIGRVITNKYAYSGSVNQSWSYTAGNIDKINKIIATQILVWEVVVGERGADFTHITPPAGTNSVWEVIEKHPYKTSVPDDISKAKSIEYYYDQIVKSVKNKSKVPELTGSGLNWDDEEDWYNGELNWNEVTERYEIVLTDNKNLISQFKISPQASLVSGSSNEYVINGIKFKIEKNGNTITISTKTRPVNGDVELPIVIEKSNGETRTGIVVWSDGMGNTQNSKQDVVNCNGSVTIQDKARIGVKVSIKKAKRTGIDISLHKKDAFDNTPLGGVAFTLTKDGDSNFEKFGTTGDNGNLTFSKLGIGTYTLMETNPPSGYKDEGISFRFKIREDRDGNWLVEKISGSANVQLSDTTIIATNQELSQLTVKKTISYNETSSEAPSAQKFTITVKLGNGNGSISSTTVEAGNLAKLQYAENGTYTLILGKDASVTIDKIPAGTKYIVTESALNDKPGYSFGSISTNKPSNNNSANAQTLTDTVDGDHKGTVNETVTVNNKYFQSKETSISGTKSWKKLDSNGALIDMEAGDELMPQSITIALYQTGKDGNPKEVDIGDKGTITAANNWKYEFTNLPKYDDAETEYNYTIKELVITYEGANPNYNVKTSDNVHFQVCDTVTKEIVGEYVKSDSGYNITNTWYPAGTENKGSTNLVVRKRNSEDGKTPLAGVTFKLTPLKAGVEDVENSQELTTKENGDITFGTLAEGDYILTEVSAPEEFERLSDSWTVTVSKELTKDKKDGKWINTWTWTLSISGEGDMYQWKSGDPNKAEGTEGYDSSLTVFNAPIKGQISIAKTVKLDDEVIDPDADTKYVEKTFHFHIYEGTEITEEQVPIELTVHPDGKAETSEKLYFGEYTIVEADQDAIDDYTWVDLSYEGDDGNNEVEDLYPDKEGFQVKITDQNQIIAVTAVNHYVRNTVDLDITKKVDYNPTTSYVPNDDQEFTFEAKFGEGESEEELKVKALELEAVNESDGADGDSGITHYTVKFPGEGTYTWKMKADDIVTVTQIPTEMKYSVKELPVCDANGEPDSRYTFGSMVSTAEEDPENAGKEIDGKFVLSGEILDTKEQTRKEEITVINHFHDRKKITIEGEKTWDLSKLDEERGLMPQSIQIDLVRKAANAPADDEPAGQAEEESAGQEKPEAEAEVVASVEITAADDWKYSFQDLDLYAGKDAENPYEYSVVEREIRYGAEDSQEVSYLVERIEGKDMFKVSKKEPTDGFNEVLGVFRVAYDAKDAVLGEDGKTTVQEIVIDNIWEIASAINGGNAFLEVAKNDTADKKPLANATFELKVGDVTMIRTSDEEGNLNFGKAYDGEGNLLHGDLPAGTYTMTETKAPEGYQKLDTVWTVTVSKKLVDVRPLDEENPSRWVNVWEWMTDVEGDEEIGNQLTVGNDKIQGSISITKELRLDDAPNAIPANRDKEYAFGIYPGTVFTGTPVETIVVKADGIAVSSGLLDYGVYTIAEIRRSDIDGFDWAGVTFGGAEDADKDAAGFQVMIAGQDETLAVTATNWYSPKEEESTTPREEETTTAPEESSSEEETTAPEESSSEEETTTPEETTTQPESSSAEETTAPTPFRGGGNGGGGGGGTGRDRERTVTENIGDEDVPLVNINPEDVPLANLPNEPVAQAPLEILDEDVPLVGLAKTGDRSVPIGVLVGLMMVSLLGALGVSRKRKEDENS